MIGCSFFFSEYLLRNRIFSFKSLFVLILFPFLIFNSIKYNSNRKYLKDSEQLLNTKSFNPLLVFLDDSPKSYFRNIKIKYDSLPNSTMNVFNAINHFRFSHESVAVISKSQSDITIKNLFTKIAHIKRTSKGRFWDLFLYKGTMPTPYLTLSSARVHETDRNNLIVNASFESARNNNEYFYEALSQSTKKHIIPPSRLFPKNYDVRWTVGNYENSFYSIYLDDSFPIEGNYSLYVNHESLASVLVMQRFNSGNYLFECDLYPLTPSYFGIQISLRNSSNDYFGFREFQKSFLEHPRNLYHFSFKLSDDMMVPFDFFYLSLCFYCKGTILVDNLSLVEIN